LDARYIQSYVKHPGATISGFLTVKGRMKEAPTMGYDAVHVVYRPDTEEDVIVLSQIMARTMKGWILLVSHGGDIESTWHPQWTTQAPKGLLLVADGSNYRRIGLFSVQTKSLEQTRLGAPIHFGEPRAITII
jgi:hypothetical protein